MQNDQSKLPTALVIFGATGDLTRRKLMPALFRLHQKQLLPQAFRIVGFSRQPLDEEGYRRQVKEYLGEIGTADERESFARLIHYVQGFFNTEQGYRDLAAFLGAHDASYNVCTNKLFYLAVPPSNYQTIFENLKESGLTIPCSPGEGWTKIAVEKPFGKDLKTAEELDELLGRLFKEEQIYRIDHYLGKETVQNILAFRFSNSILEPAWDRRSIEKISIRVLEKEGVGSRGSFYEGIGALRDVGQNHLLQLLALFTMENPMVFEADTIRQKRAEILEKLRVYDPEEANHYALRGQYAGYTNEPNVPLDSQTETYFRIKAFLDMPRWRDVPIHLESGKMMSESRAEVTVTFTHPQPCLCPPNRHYRNVLRYNIQPDEGVKTSFWVKRPGSDMVLEEKDFLFDYKSAFDKGLFIDAYEKLVLDALRGNQTLFVSTREVVASWKFTDPILKAWRKKNAPLHTYHSPADVEKFNFEADRPQREKVLGYVGLGKMGMNMAARLVRQGWQIHATDANPDMVARGANLSGAGKFNGYPNMRALVESLPAPRTVWLMVPSSDEGPINDILFGKEGLASLLAPGDTIIDGGNSFYKLAVERAEKLKRKRIRFLDAGTSGGPKGALHGACVMVGGERAAFEGNEELWRDIAAPGAFLYCGKAGAGHFVKMIHNGIEYGMMQALAEGFGILKKSPYDLDVKSIAALYNRSSVIESRLVGWLEEAYETYGADLENISGVVGHTGEGEWTVKAGEELGVPVPVIKDAFQFRVDSEGNPSYTGQVLSALRNMFGGHSPR